MLSQELLLAQFGIYDDGDRAVVDQGDGHVCTEFAGLDGLAEIVR